MKTTKKLKVCLIVDNPLRDIDGLSLIAWHLAKSGHWAALVPMYDQAFDIYAIKPDIVVVNYARPNNIELLRRFANAGISVVVMDTEGSPGRDMKQFASMVERTRVGDFIALYCLWGREQYNCFRTGSGIPEDKLRLVGCPRYDYCVEPLKKILNAPNAPGKYVLINTSFPIANPRFTSGPEEERKTMVNVGYDPDFANSYVRESVRALDEVVQTIDHLCSLFPKTQFILRPHPFENSSIYERRITHANFSVRQEQTSLDWLKNASVLLHLNCITAIEATLMGVEPIQMEWINSDVLKAQGQPINVSHDANSLSEVVALLHLVSAGEAPETTPELQKLREKIIEERYYKNDGSSAERVANEILSTKASNKSENGVFRKIPTKLNLKHFIRMMLGYKIYHFLRKISDFRRGEMRRESKSFGLSLIAKRVKEFDTVFHNSVAVNVRFAQSEELYHERLFSWRTIVLDNDTRNI